MFKKSLFASLGLTCLLAFTSCSSNEISINPDKKSYFVGITQYVRHAALDAASEGFKESLTIELKKNGRNVKFLETNAQGEPSLTNVAVSSLISRNVDLIMANATAPFQAAVNATKAIPIVGTSITSYQQALSLGDEYNGTLGINATGTTDLAPLDAQAQMIFDIIPEARKIGLIYCSAEPNSLYQIKEVEKYINQIAKDKGIEVQVSRYPFLDSNEVEQVSRKAAGDNDVLYTPTDNMVASTSLTIAAATKIGDKRVPIICGEENSCKNIGVATLSISYKTLGELTGRMAADILLGKKDIKEMPIKPADKFEKKYNEKIAKEAGIPIDERFMGYSQL